MNLWPLLGLCLTLVPIPPGGVIAEDIDEVTPTLTAPAEATILRRALVNQGDERFLHLLFWEGAEKPKAPVVKPGSKPVKKAKPAPTPRTGTFVDIGEVDSSGDGILRRRGRILLDKGFAKDLLWDVATLRAFAISTSDEVPFALVFSHEGVHRVLAFPQGPRGIARPFLFRDARTDEGVAVRHEFHDTDSRGIMIIAARKFREDDTELTADAVYYVWDGARFLRRRRN